MLRVLAVFLEGFEMIVTGAESKEAHTRPGTVGSLPSGAGGGGSEISSDSWKLFDLADPVTCRNLKLAERLWSIGALCSYERSPPSDTTVIESCWFFKLQTGPSIWTTGGGHRKRFSVPYDFWATAACKHNTVVIGVGRGVCCETWSRTTRLILLWGSSTSDASNLRLDDVRLMGTQRLTKLAVDTHALTWLTGDGPGNALWGSRGG